MPGVLLFMLSLSMATGDAAVSLERKSEAGVAKVPQSLERVRSETPGIVEVIRAASLRSPTLRRLVETVDATDGLVYVDEGRCGHSVRACLVLSLKVAGPHRLLRILVDSRKAGPDLAASIGHELQHAVEILSEPGIIDGHGMFHFFQRVGPTGHDRFETAAAVKAGMNIEDELHSSRARECLK
jgi:hypothetical protein